MMIKHYRTVKLGSYTVEIRERRGQFGRVDFMYSVPAINVDGVGHRTIAQVLMSAKEAIKRHKEQEK